MVSDDSRTVEMIELWWKLAVPLNTPTAPNSSFKTPPFFSWRICKHANAINGGDNKRRAEIIVLGRFPRHVKKARKPGSLLGRYV